MTSDLDIYRTASVLIREHREDAALEAAMRTDETLERGRCEGARRLSRSVQPALDLTIEKARAFLRMWNRLSATTIRVPI
jgi:hypothetical protein